MPLAVVVAVAVHEGVRAAHHVVAVPLAEVQMEEELARQEALRKQREAEEAAAR